MIGLCQLLRAAVGRAAEPSGGCLRSPLSDLACRRLPGLFGVLVLLRRLTSVWDVDVVSAVSRLFLSAFFARALWGCQCGRLVLSVICLFLSRVFGDCLLCGGAFALGNILYDSSVDLVSITLYKYVWTGRVFLGVLGVAALGPLSDALILEGWLVGACWDCVEAWLLA